jgi:hypothetical protein
MTVTAPTEQQPAESPEAGPASGLDDMVQLPVPN